jgi:hypothetical protein
MPPSEEKVQRGTSAQLLALIRPKVSRSGVPAAESCHQVVAAASLCCCGLTPRTRLNAVLSAKGLP